MAAAGVDLKRVLWIRCGNTYAKSSLKKDMVASKVGEPAAAQTKVWEKVKRGTTGWTHPRDQIRGIEAAIPSVMGKTERNKSFSWKVKVAETESLQGRNGVQKIMSSRSLQAEDVCQEPVNGVNRFAWKRGGKNKPWKILEQALKVTDLLLHAGGWGVVFFDLGNVSWVDVRRIELSTWFRFRRAIENTPTILLLVGEDACAKSCSSVVLRCERKAENWNSASMAGRDAEIPTFQGFAMEGQILSSRIGLPPASSAQWVAKSLWSNNF